MATANLQITSEQLLSLFRQFSREEQLRLFEQLKKIVKKPTVENKTTQVNEETTTFYKSLSSIPPMESIEEIREKYALKKEDLEPLVELFKDAPPADELVKMLSE